MIPLLLNSGDVIPELLMPSPGIDLMIDPVVSKFLESLDNSLEFLNIACILR